MPAILHGVNGIGDVRILFEGDEPQGDTDNVIEIPLSRLRSKAYLVNIIRDQYPEITKALLGENSSPYAYGHTQ